MFLIVLTFLSLVAIQCLETTFKISSSDGHLAVSQPLREIFLNALLKVSSGDYATIVVMFQSKKNDKNVIFS